MEIYLIRHTTPALAPGLIYGRTEVPLANSFPAESEALLGKLLCDFDHVYSSPATRCTFLATLIDPDYQTDSRLTELDFGDWEGKTWNTVDQNDLQIWMDDFVHVRTPGGENMIDLRIRVKLFLEEIIEKDFRKVAVITHAGVIRMFLTVQRSLPMEEFFTIEVAYGEVIPLKV